MLLSFMLFFGGCFTFVTSSVIFKKEETIKTFMFISFVFIVFGSIGISVNYFMSDEIAEVRRILW